MEIILFFIGLALGIFIGVASVFVFCWFKDWVLQCKEAVKAKRDIEQLQELKDELEKRVGELKPKISKVPDETVEIYRRKR